MTFNKPQSSWSKHEETRYSHGLRNYANINYLCVINHQLMMNESHSITSNRVDSTQVFYQHCALKIAGIAMPMIRKTGSSCNTLASLRGKTRNTFYRFIIP